MNYTHPKRLTGCIPQTAILLFLGLCLVVFLVPMAEVFSIQCSVILSSLLE
jgi:hypothetical protein